MTKLPGSYASLLVTSNRTDAAPRSRVCSWPNEPFWNDAGSRGTGGTQPMPPLNGDLMMEPVDGGASDGRIPAAVVGARRTREATSLAVCGLRTWQRHRRRGQEPVETCHNWHEEALVHGQVRTGHAGHRA